MQIFQDTNFDFLGKKWPFIIFSLVLTAAGLVSLAVKGGPAYGIDFKGGTLMYVKFAGPPPVAKIRAALSSKIAGEISVQPVVSSENELMIGTEVREERSLEVERQTVIQTLAQTLGHSGSDGKLDINNTGQQAVIDRLREPLQRAGVPLSEDQLKDLVKAILSFRDSAPRSGLIRSIDELSAVPGVNAQVLNVLKQELTASPFAIRNVEVVGPKVGAELRWQAVKATLYALAGMLVYLAFRFEWIYGVAAVIAVFHDTIITIGLFSIFNKEISLTVVAAILTLVGYSMNDTIVVFDRIRENLKLMRREKLEVLINASINQTLSRTILTSGLTFLTAASLLAFGGPVLHGFSFALVVGIIIGTYSSIFIASPILVFWNNFRDSRKRGRPAEPAPAKEGARRGSVNPVK
jgi:preprotein translocase subunit SecF